jgi:hypothetical protein
MEEEVPFFCSTTRDRILFYHFIHTYIPLSLYPQRGIIFIRGIISDIPPRRLRFTKIIYAMSNTADVTGGKPIAV